MGINNRNHSHDLNSLIGDGGVWQDFNLPVLGARTSAGLVLAGSGTTTPFVAISSGLGRVAWAATVVNVAITELSLPASVATKYTNQNVSKPSVGFKVELLVGQTSAGSPDTVVFNCRPYAISKTGVAKAWAAVTKAIPNLGAAGSKITQLEWDFTNVADANGYFLEPEDKLYIHMYPGAHANDDIVLYDGKVRVRCNQVLTDEALRD